MYPEDMRTNPSEPRRFSIRLRRPLWIGVGTVLILGVVTAFWMWIPIYRQELALEANYRPDLELSGVASHPLDERKEELEALIDDIERGETLTKRDVGSRLGKPDELQMTGHKQFSDRVISTRNRYALAPGEYLLPNSERANIGPGGSAEFSFDERVNHGKRGRLYYVVDDTTPLLRVSITDDQDWRESFLFPSSRRSFYKLPGEKQE
jgi:hypothetical protein